MRRTLRDWLFSTRDAGFLTEPQVWERLGATGTPFALARDDTQYPLARLLEAADLVGRPEAVPRQIALLRNADDGVRYWVAVGLHAAGPGTEPAREAGHAGGGRTRATRGTDRCPVSESAGFS